jgi:hypothetical protein
MKTAIIIALSVITVALLYVATHWPEQRTLPPVKMGDKPSQQLGGCSPQVGPVPGCAPGTTTGNAR